jgi:hypothetical protein
MHEDYRLWKQIDIASPPGDSLQAKQKTSLVC